MVSDFDFLDNIWPQNCGDSLKILRKSDKKIGKGYLWEAEFVKYIYKVFVQKCHIIEGVINNPQIEQVEFVDKIWHQNCGDDLRIIKRTNKKKGNEYLWKCEFIKYPYKVLTFKGVILKGEVNNPLIEENEFIGKEFLQHCEDILKVLEKTNLKQGSACYYKCKFLKYPCEILAIKSKILKGVVLNPQIEQVEFINKFWPQNCGDIIKIIKKSDRKTKNKISLFKCEFLKYKNIIYAPKDKIERGIVLNYKLPWLNKENLIKYIKENFKEKPFLSELAYSLNISNCYLGRVLNKFGLKDLICDSYDSEEENQVKKYIKSIYKGPIEKYYGTKEEKFREIDIYFPELNKGIEYNGSNWHEEGNLNNKFSKPIGYHQEKQEIFAKKGIEILFIWDYEWFEDYPKRQVVNEQIKQRIKDFIIN